MPTEKDDPSRLESWRNVSQSTIFIKRFTLQGQLLDERIGAGKAVALTPVERRINSETAADDELDVFKNGLMTPVQLLDDEYDTAEVKTRPNLLSEGDIAAAVKLAPKAFDARLRTITNHVTLRRMLEIARAQDVSVSRVQMIEDRLEEVDPNKDVFTAATPVSEETSEAGKRGRRPE